MCSKRDRERENGSLWNGNIENVTKHKKKNQRFSFNFTEYIIKKMIGNNNNQKQQW